MIRIVSNAKLGRMKEGLRLQREIIQSQERIIADQEILYEFQETMLAKLRGTIESHERTLAKITEKLAITKDDSYVSALIKEFLSESEREGGEKGLATLSSQRAVSAAARTLQCWIGDFPIRFCGEPRRPEKDTHNEQKQRQDDARKGHG